MGLFAQLDSFKYRQKMVFFWNPFFSSTITPFPLVSTHTTGITSQQHTTQFFHCFSVSHLLFISRNPVHAASSLPSFVWQVTIFPDLWEDYVACETVELVLDGSESVLHSIVVLPSSYIAASYVRVIFIPDGNQTATFKIAKRKCPT